MTPGEVKGYATQAMKRKVLTPEEKTAIAFLLETLEIMLVVAPTIKKIQDEMELSDVENNFSATSAVPRDKA